MSTARMIPTWVAAPYSALQKTTNLAFGVAAGAYSFASVIGEYGIEDTAFSLLAPVSMAFSALSAIGAVWDSGILLKNGHYADYRHIENALKLASSGLLFNVAYTAYFVNGSQLVTFGSSVALEFLCGAFAIRAAAELISRIKSTVDEYNLYLNVLKSNNNEANNSDVIAAYAKYRKALANTGLSTVNFIGWTLLALAHVPALAAATPALIAIGATFLVTGGLYAGYTAYQGVKNTVAEENAKNKSEPDKQIGFLRGIGLYCRNQRHNETQLEEALDNTPHGRVVLKG